MMFIIITITKRKRKYLERERRYLAGMREEELLAVGEGVDGRETTLALASPCSEQV